MTPTQTDYDSPWKELLDPYFRPFLELFFPTVAQAIDAAERLSAGVMGLPPGAGVSGGDLP